MSDVDLNPIPRWSEPETLADLFDPGQHFQGEFNTEEKVEAEIKRVEAEEKGKIDTEKKEAAAKKLEAQRKARKSAASRTGRRASIATGPLGIQEGSDVRRASLGGGY